MVNVVRYEKMADMFLNTNKHRSEWISNGIDKKRLASILFTLEHKKQLLSTSTSFGMPKAYIAWVYCKDGVTLDELKNKQDDCFTEDGKNVFPLFMAGAIGLGLARKYGKKLTDLAKQRGGKLISYRHGRLVEFGGDSV